MFVVVFYGPTYYNEMWTTTTKVSDIVDQITAKSPWTGETSHIKDVYVETKQETTKVSRGVRKC